MLIRTWLVTAPAMGLAPPGSATAGHRLECGIQTAQEGTTGTAT